MRRSTLVCVLLVAAFGCARKTGPAHEPASSNSAIAEHEGAALDAEACSHYLADAPPPLPGGEFMPVSEEQMAAAMAAIREETMPRCAHYELAHVAMVIALFDDPRVSQALWEREDSMILLDALAKAVNEVCGEANVDEWLLPTPAFQLGRTELLERPVIVVDMLAPPVATTEAHMFAIVGHPWPADADRRVWTGLDRYFVLEHSVSGEPTHTVMGGWTRSDTGDTHLNMGDGPLPTPTGFLHAIGQNLCANYVGARTHMGPR
jgi:hypothetical protein